MLSPECDVNGSGECDGFFGDHICACGCHDLNNLPATIEGVKDWHDEMHEVGPYAPDVAHLPAFAVMDLSDGYVWTKDKTGQAFRAAIRAQAFADDRNHKIRPKTFKVYALSPLTD